MNEVAVDNERTKMVRSLVVLVLAVVMAGFLLWSLMPGQAEPLSPAAGMESWAKATPAQRNVTANVLFEHMQQNGLLGPSTKASLKNEPAIRGFVQLLRFELDDAANRNHGSYVSPGQPIARTVEDIAKRRGWTN